MGILSTNLGVPGFRVEGSEFPKPFYIYNSSKLSPICVNYAQ